jgi:hypothetical protein
MEEWWFKRITTFEWDPFSLEERLKSYLTIKEQILKTAVSHPWNHVQNEIEDIAWRDKEIARFMVMVEACTMN